MDKHPFQKWDSHRGGEGGKDDDMGDTQGAPQAGLSSMLGYNKDQDSRALRAERLCSLLVA